VSQVNISKALQIAGWMSKIELTWLALSAQKCDIIVEIGSFLGKSARALADNSSNNCKIYCVDPWTGYYPNVTPLVNTAVFPEFVMNLSDHIKADKVIPIREYSDCFDIPYIMGKVDMFFIDGDHTYVGAKEDIKLALTYLKPDGLLCGHDYSNKWPGVMKAVTERVPNFQIEDTIWWKRLNSH
jgi:predicted O-methyltransferase YrrM